MLKMFSSPLGLFRIVSFAEGVSFLLLLLIAMPLKYVAGLPLMVRICGSIHGFLFVLFVLALVHVAFDRSWRLGRVLCAFVASIIPFGAFVLERSLKQEFEQTQASADS